MSSWVLRWWAIVGLAGCGLPPLEFEDDDDGGGLGDAPADSDTDGEELDLDGDGFGESEDCDDLDPQVFPGADERCDGIDNDCNGLVDDDPIDLTEFFVDADGDGAGVFADSILACRLPPTGYVDTVEVEDCNDAEPTVFPEADELCDGIDNDCDVEVDEEPVDGVSRYADSDGDGFGDNGITATVCPDAEGWTPFGGDCDDTRDTVYPNAPEVCDGVDNDCNGAIEATQVPSPYATIQDAIDALGSGEICVGAGTYADGFDLSGTSVSVIASGGPSVTTLEISSTQGTLITADGATDSSVERFAVRRPVTDTATDPAGRPLLLALTHTDFDLPTGTTALRDLTFEDVVLRPSNTQIGRRFGGLVSSIGGHLELTDVTLSDVELLPPSGDQQLLSGLLVVIEGGSLTVDGLILDNLTLTAPAVPTRIVLGGAALWAEDADIQLDRWTVDEATVELTSGAAFGTLAVLQGCDVEGSEWDIHDVEVTGNGATSSMEGLVHAYGSGGSFTLDGASFRDNTVSAKQSRTTTTARALLMVEEQDVAIDRLTATGNLVEANTDESDAGYAWGSVLSLFECSDIALRWLDLRGNRTLADNTARGTIYVGENNLFNGTAEVEHAILAGNQVGGPDTLEAYGGGLALIGFGYDALRLTQADIFSNEVEAIDIAEGGGLWLILDTFATLEGTMVSVADNSVSATETDGAAVWGNSQFATVDWTYSNVHGNSGADDWTTYADPAGATGNIALDPQYTNVSNADPAQWDLTLQSTSGLVNAGDPAVQDPNGTTADIGAFGGPGGDEW